MSKYSYYTDGAATMINKKGKYLREAGGWAFILLKDGEKYSNASGDCPTTTNNENGTLCNLCFNERFFQILQTWR